MTERFFVPAMELQYEPLLNKRDTCTALELISQTFTEELKRSLHLRWVPSPLIVPANSGINDDLSGHEQKVSFTPLAELGHADSMPSQEQKSSQVLEVVQSLAKWKRRVLSDKEQYDVGEGILAHTTALRKDDDVDNLHSLTVHQWDFEFIISKEQHNIEFLKQTVRTIWAAIKRTETVLLEQFGEKMSSRGPPKLPEEITFVHSEHLLDAYPQDDPEERERKITKEHGAVFIVGIGGPLLDSQTKHSSRAPDYDDWTSVTGKYGRRFQTKGLNGDILVWNTVLNRAVELSSLGIRVDKAALEKQCLMAECTERLQLPFHRSLLDGELPQTLGGGIGKSRLKMQLLGQAHVGEGHVSYWPSDHMKSCEQHNIRLLS